jgi:hypothetical protein
MPRARAKLRTRSVGVREWELDAFDKIENCLGRAVRRVFAEAVNEALESGLKDEADIGFSHDNPDHIVMWMPFDTYKYEYDGPEFGARLSDAVNSEIENCEDDEDAQHLCKIGKNLAELSKKILDYLEQRNAVASKGKPDA